MCSTLFCTFVCHCLGRLQVETSRNFLVTHFMEKMSYVSMFTFFFTSLIFTLVDTSISHFLTTTTKFHVLPPSLLLQLFFCRPTISFSLSTSFSIFQICGHDNFIKLSLILQTTRIQKIFPFSVFLFIDSLVVFASQGAGGHTLSCLACSRLADSGKDMKVKGT